MSAIRSLSITDFRNFADLRIEFERVVTVVYGANGQGKTNLLEAMYLAATGRILRGVRDSEAIRHGCGATRLQAVAGPPDFEIEISLAQGRQKAVKVNGVVLGRASDLLGRIYACCISTEDMELIRGEPAVRRYFLDFELSSVKPGYLAALARYRRSLDHRNALLKRAQDGSVESGAFEPWESQMAESGAILKSHRRDFLARLAPEAAQRHGAFGSAESLELSYAEHDAFDTPDELRCELLRRRNDDILRGWTGVGPHRDDLKIAVEGKEARLYASQGQQRTAVISIKVATMTLAREMLGATPILLLDDILSDLDASRRAALLEAALASTGQVVITCTDPDVGGPKLRELAAMFCVTNGSVALA